ncbi:MAG: hypothetical protein IIB02_01285 [Thaumarchaeota archaeon]|nr:hypothetical protein [Nitrososphaerota archaeon]
MKPVIIIAIAVILIVFVSAIIFEDYTNTQQKALLECTNILRGFTADMFDRYHDENESVFDKHAECMTKYDEKYG